MVLIRHKNNGSFRQMKTEDWELFKATEAGKSYTKYRDIPANELVASRTDFIPPESVHKAEPLKRVTKPKAKPKSKKQ